MLTVWEQRPSLGNSEDQSKLNLLINEGLGEGNLTEQCETWQRVLAPMTLRTFEDDPPDQRETSGS